MPDSARNDVWAQGAGSYGKIHLTARASGRAGRSLRGCGAKFPDQKSGGQADSGDLSRSNSGNDEKANVEPHRDQNIWDREL